MSKKKLLTVIQILSLLIFLGCAIYLGKYYYDSYKAQSEIGELQSLVDAAEQKSDTSDSQTGENEEIKDTYESNGMLSCYASLAEKNSDMVGWLKINGTKINYPVMYKSDNNDYYMHRNFDKEQQYSGLPFMDYQCDLTMPSDNIIIYAHNMKDGTMFADLSKYEDEDFYSEHKIINFDTLYERGKYELVAAFRTDSGHDFEYYNFITANNSKEYDKFITEIKKRAIYDTGITPVIGDELITLSTCSYHESDGRFVVVARKTED